MGDPFVYSPEALYERQTFYYLKEWATAHARELGETFPHALAECVGTILFSMDAETFKRQMRNEFLEVLGDQLAQFLPQVNVPGVSDAYLYGRNQAPNPSTVPLEGDTESDPDNDPDPQAGGPGMSTEEVIELYPQAGTYQLPSVSQSEEEQTKQLTKSPPGWF